ncbi:MAG TPA: DNRLRE domain-containing protein, partial [Cytophagales bacterium]|nr:DNRLRE domain-containing protein [Cytophagales bacterium]
KILRVNPNGTAPADNPFYSDTASEQRKRVWSYGVRNPFTFDVHPTTGQILVNDVGQDMWEEINDITIGGKNYGWPTSEGKSTNAAFTNPVYTYSHLGGADTSGCAITGGSFFTPTVTNYPSRFKNLYFYMDYCNNWMNALDPSTGKITKFYKGLAGSPVVVDVGSDGNLYYLSRDNSAIYKIVYSGSAEPTIVTHPISQTVAETQPLHLSVVATGTAPFAYQWKKNGVNIAGATAATLDLPAVTPADSGSYTVSVSNAAGTAVSNVARITIGPKNSKPVATILAPLTGTLYKAGDTFTFSGSATDEEDGALPATALTWYLDFHHDTHSHDGPPIASGKASGSITIPTTGETSDTVWYVLKLIATDAAGLKDTATIELRPRKSTLTFTTQPVGLKVNVDDQLYTGPTSILSVQNLKRHLAPVSPQVLNGVHYKFEKWIHGGSADQVISTPVTNTTYTAVYASYTPDTVILKAVADAYIQDGTLNIGDTSIAFGSTNPTQLVSKVYSQGPNRRVLLRFDISKYTAEINSVQLQLFGGIESSEFTTGAKIPVGVYTSPNITWNETMVNWNKRPTVSTAFLDTVTVNNNMTVGKNYIWDVTNYVRQAKAAGSAQITFVLINTKDLLPRVIFHSKENTSGRAPQLTVIRKPLVAAVDELLAESNMNAQIYPNPSKEGFHVVLPHMDMEITDLKVVNLLGEVVQQQAQPENVFGANLSQGVYIVEFRQDGALRRVKLIKE